MQILILEDNAERIAAFVMEFEGNPLVVVNDARQAVRLLESMTFDIAFLDHDLGGVFLPSDEKSGYHVAMAMAADERHRDTRVVVHSWNEDAAKRMVADLKASGMKVRREMFGTFDKGILYEEF